MNTNLSLGTSTVNPRSQREKADYNIFILPFLIPNRWYGNICDMQWKHLNLTDSKREGSIFKSVGRVHFVIDLLWSPKISPFGITPNESFEKCGSKYYRFFPKLHRNKLNSLMKSVAIWNKWGFKISALLLSQFDLSVASVFIYDTEIYMPLVSSVLQQ